MPVYTIDLALRSACHDYAPLIVALRRVGARPVMGKRWMVEGDDVRAGIAALVRCCAPGDALFVVELARGPAAGASLTCDATAADPRPAPPRSRPAAPSG